MLPIISTPVIPATALYPAAAQLVKAQPAVQTNSAVLFHKIICLLLTSIPLKDLKIPDFIFKQLYEAIVREFLSTQ